MMLEIRVSKGTKSLYVGANSSSTNENELLLSRDLSYKVISKDEHNMILEVVNNERK